VVLATGEYDSPDRSGNSTANSRRDSVRDARGRRGDSTGERQDFIVDVADSVWRLEPVQSRGEINYMLKIPRTNGPDLTPIDRHLEMQVGQDVTSTGRATSGSQSTVALGSTTVPATVSTPTWSQISAIGHASGSSRHAGLRAEQVSRPN